MYSNYDFKQIPYHRCQFSITHHLRVGGLPAGCMDRERQEFLIKRFEWREIWLWNNLYKIVWLVRGLFLISGNYGWEYGLICIMLYSGRAFINFRITTSWKDWILFKFVFFPLPKIVWCRMSRLVSVIFCRWGVWL